MHVELVTNGVMLSEPQARAAAAAANETLLVSGPPGSGKTTALAAHAARLRASGRTALVICSHASSARVFARRLQALGGTPLDATGAVEIGMLCEHAARWMRADYAAARVSPRLRVGDASATKDILRDAGAGLLDMSWPVFARRQFNLDLPHLSRPEAFFDEAAALFTLLQRVRIGPDEFEAGCDAGLAAFYGENVERAVVLVQDPVVRERASQRGREACRAPATTLALQRAAERDVAAILAQLYREYLVAAAKADVRAPEDIVDAAIRWLTHDRASARRIAHRYASVLIDDAEDGEPGLGALVTVLKDAGALGLLVAGWEAARVDGLQGRRSALGLGERAKRVDLSPREPFAVIRQERAADETAEVGWLAQQMSDLLRGGEEPAGIAMLCRGEDTAAHYARQLRALGLPVALPGSTFEDETALEDLLALCSLVDDAMQAGPLLRLLSSPVLGLSDATVWLLCRDTVASAQLALPGAEPPAGQHSTASGKALADNVIFGAADAALSPEQRTKIASFRENLRRWCEQAAHLTPGQRLLHLAAAAGFMEHWQSAEPYRRERLSDDLQRLAEALEGAQADGVLVFRQAAQRLQRGELAARRASSSRDAIASASIACAKGERWRHVFIAGVAHERFPRIYTSHAIAFSRTFGLIVRENVARGAAQTAKFAWYYAKFGAKDMYLEEERRALDYGLSRATESAAASGFGSPPRWAKQQDLLARLGVD